MADKSLPVCSDDTAPLTQDKGDISDSFHKAMDQFIDDFFTSFDFLPLSVFEDADAFIPRFSIQHDKKHVTITAVLPGLEAQDIEITLKWDTLIITGEKKKPGEYLKIGSIPQEARTAFYRKIIPIPFCIDAKNVRATFSKGMLQVTLPRLTGENYAKIRIPIKKAVHGA